MKARFIALATLLASTSFSEESVTPVVVPLFQAPANSEEAFNTEALAQFVALVQQQDWPTARMLADEIIAEAEGLPRFDLYYGILLMQERAFDQAIFPLERVLFTNPSQHRARLELGRAYYFLGNFERAKVELNQVLAINPPTNVKTRVETLLAAIESAQSSRDVSNVVGVSLLAGWDNNANGGSSLDEALDSNLLGLTELSNDSEPLSSGFGQWSINYALIKPTSQTGSQRLLFDYTNRLYTEPELPSTHTFTLGGLITSEQDKLRSSLPINIQLALAKDTLAQLTFDANYQLELLAWGPLWAGVKIGTQPSISLNDSSSTSVKDMAALVLNASERGRDHTFLSQYLQTSIAGEEDGHIEWRAMANQYQLNWPLKPALSLTSQFEHQWRIYKDEDLFFTVDEESTELKTRQDHILSLNSQVNWQASPWLTSQTRLSFEWLRSNINAYERNRFAISQAISVQF
ncbi:tetratricopeptide repeat protein [Reinekea forsetii]|nr:tetratricopeptide repeat protein [Reinekea forsetii]